MRILSIICLPLMLLGTACAPSLNQYGQPAYGQAGYNQEVVCQGGNGNNTVVGIGGGALAGGLLGNQVAGRGQRGTGTVVGGVVGGILGGLVGSASEQNCYPVQRRAYPHQYQQHPQAAYGQHQGYIHQQQLEHQRQLAYRQQMAQQQAYRQQMAQQQAYQERRAYQDHVMRENARRQFIERESYAAQQDRMRGYNYPVPNGGYYR